MTLNELEYQIEADQERRMDRIDSRFIAGKMTQREYDAACKKLAADYDRDWQRAKDVWPHLFA